MFKSPRRNGRNKKSKIKHVIQISILLGVSIWLLYQIHHSDDKKSSITTKISHKVNNDSSKDIVKLGRKVLRPKVKETKEHYQPDDEQNNGNEGSEDVEDHESDEQMEVGENEHADGEEISEHEKEKENDDKGHEQTGKIKMEQSEELEGNVDEKKSNKRNQVEVLQNNQNIEKKMSPNLKDVEMSSPSEDGDDYKMMNDGEDERWEDDTSSSERTSVDHEHNSKKQTAQEVNSAPDSYSYETNTANYKKSTGNDKNMQADSESEQKDDVSILEEEKDALTDLETLPESRSGGSITLDIAATE